jgi:hypothetical protein
MLCKTCQNIFQGPYPHKRSDHHSYISQLERAAFEECCICKVLWNAISGRPPTGIEEALEAPRMQEAVAMKPISQYDIRHKSSRSRDNVYDISELSFIVDQKGIKNGGRAFMFCLQPMRGESAHCASDRS